VIARGCGLAAVAAGLLSLALAGCAHTLATYPPSIANHAVLREGAAAPLALGTFTTAPGNADGQGVAARDLVFKAPQGDYASYLRAAIEAELRQAGRYDPAAPLKLSGVLQRNSLDAGVPKGGATLQARFRLERGGRAIYEGEQRVETVWESSFVGILAVPVAETNYVSAYQKLIGQLFADPAFRAAMAR
jgi:hypothetical protein